MPLPEFQSQSIPLNSVQHSAIVDFLELLFSGAIQVVPVTMCFCGNIEFEGLSRCDRFGLPFGTQICTECGLISQTVQLTQDSMPLFYEKIYWPLVTGTTPEAAQKDRYITPPKTDEVSSYILDCIANPRGKYKVFEVGCGSGLRIKRLSDELSGLGCDVEIFGSDYSPDALSQAKENDVTVVQGGFDELGVFGKADILILSHVFEHFPDLSLALSQINAVINDDSLVYIEVPGVNDLENKKEYSFNYQYYSVVAHTYNFSLQSLCNVMSAGGFRLIDGDEYVRSVFVRDKSGANFASAYEKSIDALQRASSKWKQLELRRNKPVVRYFRNLAKAILARGVQ